MPGVRFLIGPLVGAAFFTAVLAMAHAGPAPIVGVEPVKLGLESMSKTERDDLWKRVDEYATVDALQEFCGKNLNLQRRAWSAVGTCVEVKSFRRVLSVFRTKKAGYLKAWNDLHGEEKHKKEVCEHFKAKLGEYARIISSQIAEAAKMCSNCFFC
jgi:hypothetical protein